jgi:hypothetical protein
VKTHNLGKEGKNPEGQIAERILEELYEVIVKQWEMGIPRKARFFNFHFPGSTNGI